MKTITLENGEKVSISDESYKALASSITKVDFSQYVGRNDDILAIKGEKMLKSYQHGIIIYGDDNHLIYDCLLSYEEISPTQLEKGDVFYRGSLGKAKNNTLYLHDFGVFVGFDNDDNATRYQYLINRHGNELIEIGYYMEGRVVRFKRG